MATMTVLSKVQRKALRAMSDQRVGSIYTAQGWVFRDDVRNSINAAKAVLASLTCKGCGEPTENLKHGYCPDCQTDLSSMYDSKEF